MYLKRTLFLGVVCIAFVVAGEIRLFFMVRARRRACGIIWQE